MGLKTAIETLCIQAAKATQSGITLLVLSDLDITDGLTTIPAAMATGAVHHYLIEQGLRTEANIIVQTGTVRDSHHFAVLFGYGATAVYPYLAYESMQDMRRSKELCDELSIKKSSATTVKPSIKAYLKSCLRWGFQPSPPTVVHNCLKPLD